jgi:hypothetical protein
LTPIVEQFGADTGLLYNGPWGENYRASFGNPSGPVGINEDLELFCDLIQNLKGEAKELWEDSFSKVFDLGFESGNTNQSYMLQINRSVIQRVAACGATIAITIYPWKEPPE